MATSGTRQWTMTVEDVCREAFERIGGEPVIGQELASARRSLNIICTELINRGVNLFQLQEVVVTVASSVATVTLATSVVDVLKMAYRTSTQGDIEMERITFADYLRISDKTQTGEISSKYFIDRKYDFPVVYIWPVPDNSVDRLYMWRTRRMEDITAGNQDISLPFRFMPVLASGLAYHMAVKRKGISPDLIMLLKGQYEEAITHAKQEDRDRSPFKVWPKLSRV